MEQLPTFIVIGAMKAGTTSLASYLGTHPDVFMTTPKEPRFFGVGSNANWEKGLDWYRSFFAEARGQTARGEASPSYTDSPRVRHVPEQIASVVPDVKLVYVLRHPIDRIRSMYLDRCARGVETLPFANAIEAKPLYLDASRYGYQLDLYLEHFGREQVLLLSSDRLKRDRRAALCEVFEFIGVDPKAGLVELEWELNRTSDKRVPRSSYQRLSTPFRRSGVDRLVPAGVKRRLRTALSRPATADSVEIAPDLERAIWSELAPDLCRLREVAGPDLDLWTE